MRSFRVDLVFAFLYGRCKNFSNDADSALCKRIRKQNVAKKIKCQYEMPIDVSNNDWYIDTQSALIFSCRKKSRHHTNPFAFVFASFIFFFFNFACIVFILYAPFNGGPLETISITTQKAVCLSNFPSSFSQFYPHSLATSVLPTFRYVIMRDGVDWWFLFIICLRVETLNIFYLLISQKRKKHAARWGEVRGEEIRFKYFFRNFCQFSSRKSFCMYVECASVCVSIGNMHQ